VLVETSLNKFQEDVNNTKQLSYDNFYNELYPKNKIIIGNTASKDMEHTKLWQNKMNGKFKGTAAYTIGLDGTIYEHYNPKYYSDFVNMGNSDKNIIPILIENEGWLNKNYNSNELITWSGDIYKGDTDICEIKWRGKTRWAPYQDIQIDSLALLCEELINIFNIERHVSYHNTKIDDIEEKEGIYYRSNYNTNYLDVSPAFKFKEFKNKIEENGKL
jgi:hypothetical protein